MHMLTPIAPSKNPSVFSFDAQSVRITVINGEPWFAAQDVMDALEYAETYRPAKATAHIPEEWKGVHPIHTLSRSKRGGGVQGLLCLSEPGLYFFLGRSDKPKALPFQKWLAGEVLPAIRKTGFYADPDRLKDAFSVASELAKTAAITVFESLMAGDGDWQLDRWMFALNYDSDGSMTPHASLIDRKATVASLERLAEVIKMPGGICPTDKELADLAEACCHQLSKRAAYRMSKMGAMA